MRTALKIAKSSIGTTKVTLMWDVSGCGCVGTHSKAFNNSYSLIKRILNNTSLAANITDEYSLTSYSRILTARFNPGWSAFVHTTRN